ncbi:hypothetical protein OSTOST_16696, partial [Ostertagia ostertagi]
DLQLFISLKGFSIVTICFSASLFETSSRKHRIIFLAVSKAHINRPTDLTAADIPLDRHGKDGREYLRAELKAKGQADTVEDMLRVGFHWPPLVTVNHLHMHIIYPISELLKSLAHFIKKGDLSNPCKHPN